MEKLIKFKESLLKKTENKEEKDFVKTTSKKFIITTTMMFRKNISIRKKNKTNCSKEKTFDYKKLKLADDYDYTSDEEDVKPKLDEETKTFIEE